MLRWLVLTICMSMATLAFGMALEDCLALKSYYIERDAVVERKIGELDQQIRSNPSDAFLYLAKSSLLTVLASNSVNPDPNLAKQMVQNADLFLAKQPNDPFGIMYKGIALGYSAKASQYLFEQLQLIGDAIELYDKSEKMMRGGQYEWWARSMRGSSYAQFPLALGKRDIAMADLEYVEKAFAKDESLIGEAVVAFYYLGELRQSLGQRELAVNYWKKAATLNNGSNLLEGRKAELRVAKLRK